jgi:molybdopterin molybdotransferase
MPPPPEPATPGPAQPGHDDVRMRGFRGRTALDGAIARILDAVSPLGSVEDVPIRESLGRLLAADVRSPRDVPSFDRSAMDGYAVEAKRTVGATVHDPVVLEVAGESLPGAPFADVLSGARAVRIMTGAPMPAGADAVVPAEFAEESRGMVRVAGSVTTGRHVSRTGEDLAEGATVLSEGHRLRPQDQGILAALGLDVVRAAPRPRAALLATGDEIVRPGAKLGPFQVYDADTPMLAGLLERWGGRVASVTRQPDEPARLRRAMGRALSSPGSDLVLVTGGSSVGTEDHTPGLIAEAGKLVFHGVALRPAGPVAFGVVDGKPIFGLPGNPVSCLCAFDLLVGPCLRRLQGLPPVEPYRRVRLPLAERVVSAPGRADYVRVVLGEKGLEPVAVSSSSILSSAVRADGWILVPPAVEAWEAGEVVEARLY